MLGSVDRSMASSSGSVASTPNNTQTRNQTVLVIGHSFVKRLLASAIAARKRNLGLDYAKFTVILHGVSGLKLTQFEAEVRQLVSCVQPDFVFFEMGTNDICDGENASVVCLETAHRMVDLARWVVGECHAKVYVGEILPRNVELCNHKWPVPHDFNDRVISVNKTVADLTSEIPQIKLWLHMGLNNFAKVLSADGVHMNTWAMKKYLRSIRGAILHWTNA